MGIDTTADGFRGNISADGSRNVAKIAVKRKDFASAVLLLAAKVTEQVGGVWG